MSKKIFRTMVSMAIGVLLVTVVSIIPILYGYFDEYSRKEFSHEAQFLAKGVQRGGMEYLDSLPKTDHRITWIDPKGTVRYDSHHEDEFENHADRPEVKKAIQDGVGIADRKSDTLGKRMVYYAIRLKDDSILRLSIPQSSLTAMVFGVLQPILIIFFVLVVASFLLANALSKRIVKPINEMNLSSAKDDPVYEELSPLVRRIHSQRIAMKQQNETLEGKQRELEMIMGHMREGLILVDPDMAVVSINDSALKLLETPKIDVYSSVLMVHRSLEFQEFVEEVLGGVPKEMEISFPGRVCHLIGSPTYDADGNRIGAVILVLDVTEKAEREMLRREFTANVSHEMKTPLTSISGFAELLKNGMVKPEDVPRFSETIYNEAQRMIQLVSDILELSVYDEKRNVPMESVDVMPVLKQAVDDLKSKADAKHVTVALRGPEITMCGNRKSLYEIAHNLLENAIKYNKDGGSVIIRTLDEPDRVGFRVADTGIGIAPEDQDRVFERFYRVDKSRSSEYEGTGLGLSIVKNAAASIGATVDLKSRPGEGTEFTVSRHRNMKNG